LIIVYVLLITAYFFSAVGDIDGQSMHHEEL